MSIVVTNPEGETWVFCKGADNIMLEKSFNTDFATILNGHLI